MSYKCFVLNPYNDTFSRLQKKIDIFCKEKEQYDAKLTLEIVKRYYWIDVLQRIAVISSAVKLAQKGVSLRIILRGQQTVKIDEIVIFKEILKEIAIFSEVELVIDQRSSMNDWSLLEILQGKVIENLVLKVIQNKEDGLWGKSNFEGLKIAVKKVKMVIQCDVPIELHKYFAWPEEVVLFFDMKHIQNGQKIKLKFISQLNDINRLEITFSKLMRKEERVEIIQGIAKQLPKIPVISINLQRNKQIKDKIVAERDKGRQDISFSSISEDELKNSNKDKIINKNGISFKKNGKVESYFSGQTENSKMIMEITHSKDCRSPTKELLLDQYEEDYLNWEELEGNDKDYSLESYSDSDDSEKRRVKKQQRILEEEQEIIKELEDEMILKGLKDVGNYDNKEQKQGKIVEKVEEESEVRVKDSQRDIQEILLESNVSERCMLEQKQNIITDTLKVNKEQKKVQEIDFKNEKHKEKKHNSAEKYDDHNKHNKQDVRKRSKPARVGKQGGKSLRKGGIIPRRKKHSAKSKDEDYNVDNKRSIKGQNECHQFQKQDSTRVTRERKERDNHRKGSRKLEKQEGEEESQSEYSFHEDDDNESLSSQYCDCSDSCSCSQYSNNSKTNKRQNTKKEGTGQIIPISGSGEFSEGGWQAKQKEEQQLQLTYSPLSTTSSSDSFSSDFQCQAEDNLLSEEVIFYSYNELFQSLSKLTICDVLNNARLQKLYLKVNIAQLVNVCELLQNQINLSILVLHVKSEPISSHSKLSFDERQSHNSNKLRMVNTLTIVEEDQQNQLSHAYPIRESFLVEFVIQVVKSSTLTSLNLTLNSISESSFTLLMQSITSYQHLKHLHLHFKHSLQFNNEILLLLANIKLHTLSCHVNKTSQTFFYQLILNLNPQILQGIFLEIESLPTLQLKFFQLTLPFVSISLNQPLMTKSKLLIFHNNSYKIYRNSSNKQPSLFSNCFVHTNSVLLSAVIFRKLYQSFLPRSFLANSLNELNISSGSFI